MSDQSGPKPRPPGPLPRAWDSDLLWSFRRAPVAVVSAVVVRTLMLAALLAPLFAPHDPFDPATLNLMNGFTPPGEANAVPAITLLALALSINLIGGWLRDA